MTPKQKKFIVAYLGEARYCAAKAARVAGYTDAAHEGWRLKNNPEILSAINEALDAEGMSEQEAVSILSDQARGSIEPFLRHDAEGTPVIDISSNEAQENLHLIKSVRTKRKVFTGADSSSEEIEVQIELYDKQIAAKNIAQIRGAYTQKLNVTIEDDGVERTLETKLDALSQRMGFGTDDSTQ